MALASRLLGIALLLIMGSSCGAGVRPADRVPDSDALPALDELDTLRGARAVNPANLDEFNFIDARNTSALPDGLLLTPPEDGFAWVIYRVEPPTEQLLTARVLGSGDLWLMVADFGKNRWRQAALLNEGVAESAFSTLDGYRSDSGFAYFALLTPQGGSGLIDVLQFDYEGPANLRYVAMSGEGGDDTAPGTIDQPWATLQHAADTVGPDTLVIVRAGSYAGFNITQGGSAGLPVIYRADGAVTISAPAPGRQVGISMISGDLIGHVSIEGFSISGMNSYGIHLEGENFGSLSQVTLRGNDCSGNSGSAVFADFVDDLTLEGNTFSGSTFGAGIEYRLNSDRLICRGNELHGNAFGGLRVDVEFGDGGDGIMSDALVEGNHVSGNGGAGLFFAGLDNSVIRNNLLHGNESGIYLFKDLRACTNCLIQNNTVVQEVGTGDALLVGGDCTGNRVFNNILLSPGPTGAAIHTTASALTDFTSNNNVLSNSFIVDMDPPQIFSQWQGNTGQDIASLVAEQSELFADPVAADYHLKDGSPAIGLADLSETPETDISGQARPQGAGPDSGCYERE